MQTALNALTEGFSPDEPGVIVMVHTDNGATWYSCRGMADVATRTPVTPDTIFNLASVSKQFTAFSLLLLVQEGKISLSDSVLSVLPELGEYARPVTLRHLLHHTGGLKDYMDLAFARKTGFYDPLTPQETLADLVSQTEADFPPEPAMITVIPAIFCYLRLLSGSAGSHLLILPVNGFLHRWK